MTPTSASNPDPSSLTQGACVVLLRKFGSFPFVLTVTRPDSTHLCMPGGKREPSESALSNAVRELYEETGVQVDPRDLRLAHTAPSPTPEAARYSIDVFLGFWKPEHGEPTPREPSIEPSWADVDDYLNWTEYRDFYEKAWPVLAVLAPGWFPKAPSALPD